MPDSKKAPFDAAAYWHERYNTIDLSRSGHIDLPTEYNAWLYRRKQDHVARAVAKVGGSMRGAKLLEIAAGSGAWMNFWKSQGIAEYLGIDLSERAVADLTLRFPEDRFLQHDLNDLGLPEVAGIGYDFVSAIDVLYYVVDDKKFCAVIADLALELKEGGLLIIHDQFLHSAARDHGYIKWRSLRDYEDALRTAGLEILYRRSTFFLMIQNVDLKGLAAKLHSKLWDYLTFPAIRRFPRLSGIIGYSVDSVVCSVLHEGPSMEMMICRKRT
jgi:Methyltransferase domain